MRPKLTTVDNAMNHKHHLLYYRINMRCGLLSFHHNEKNKCQHVPPLGSQTHVFGTFCSTLSSKTVKVEGPAIHSCYVCCKHNTVAMFSGSTQDMHHEIIAMKVVPFSATSMLLCLYRHLLWPQPRPSPYLSSRFWHPWQAGSSGHSYGIGLILQ